MNGTMNGPLKWAMVDSRHARVHVSHDVHASMPAKSNTKHTWRKNRFASPSERAAADLQNFWLLENETLFL